ncbi:hypothetical protein [Arenibaculum sp.]|jgi:hypothetical protein|uniref:hypothetical protein n=1 Tax=Arenibaculum sp. TaxID=2865862 RepID=UPI002E154958|nr:hypothetical protein [Arenibaculum sp.]
MAKRNREPADEPKTGDEMLHRLRRGDAPTAPGEKVPNSGTPDDPGQGVPDTVR